MQAVMAADSRAEIAARINMSRQVMRDNQYAPRRRIAALVCASYPAPEYKDVAQLEVSMEQSAFKMGYYGTGGVSGKVELGRSSPSTTSALPGARQTALGSHLSPDGRRRRLGWQKCMSSLMAAMASSCPIGEGQRTDDTRDAPRPIPPAPAPPTRQ
jgi:hypothetical protein